MTNTVEQLLADAARELGMNRAREEALREGQILLGFVLGVSRAWLIAHRQDKVDAAPAAAFAAQLVRRARGEPVAYLVGQREFYGRAFQVTPDVLIPRPETELLIDAALSRLPAEADCDVLDLGTGSGCIAVTLSLERDRARVCACDLSVSALAVAEGNARQLGAGVEFLESDWFQRLPNRRFDLIVANPPYIASGDPHLGQGDLRFEPQFALSAGADGLADIRRIVGEALDHLHDGGWLILEHGHEQSPACRQMMIKAGFTDVFDMRDLAGLPRICGGRLLTGKTPTR
ncbi:MAG: peptide chain release factor N(5)-glutamine methyltransferase [Burkholderiales bacterium]